MAVYTARDVVKTLKKNGFYEESVRGDHHKFTNSAGNVVIIPYSSLKSSIAPGTYNAILHQAGLK